MTLRLPATIACFDSLMRDVTYVQLRSMGLMALLLWTALGLCCTAKAVVSDRPWEAASPWEAPGQTLPDAPGTPTGVTEKGLPLAILKDQIPLWTSPSKIRTHDLVWLLPLGAAMGVTLSSDTDAMRDVSRDRAFNKDNVNASNILLGSEIAIPVGLYGVGLLEGNAKARQTGIVGGEALADGVIFEELTKIIFRRERPLYHNAAGDFFASGVGANGSFPSSHSTLAWALTGFLVGEYPSKWVQLGLYSMSTGISLTRVLGQEHFPTDVLVGSAAGWLIGQYVSRKHRPHH